VAGGEFTIVTSSPQGFFVIVNSSLHLFPANCPDEESLIDLGKTFAQVLKPGSIVALDGPLGAGKTHFTKGLALGLGYQEPVTSPTFSLVQEYRGGRLPIFHFDFYRLDSAEELLHLGWDDYLDEGGIVIAEWAERFPELLPSEQTFQLNISIGADLSRRVSKT